MSKKKQYDESAIQTMDPLTHIRMRSGMYNWSIRRWLHIDDGIYVLLKEIIDNSIDEFIMHHGDKINISYEPDISQISVRDYGRGIPLGKVIDCVSQSTQVLSIMMMFSILGWIKRSRS